MKSPREQEIVSWWGGGKVRKQNISPHPHHKIISWSLGDKLFSFFFWTLAFVSCRAFRTFPITASFSLVGLWAFSSSSVTSRLSRSLMTALRTAFVSRVVSSLFSSWISSTLSSRSIRISCSSLFPVVLDVLCKCHQPVSHPCQHIWCIADG